MPNTTPAPSDEASATANASGTAASGSAQRALDAVQVALDRRDNGGEAATTGHRRINCTTAGKDHLGRRPTQA